MIKMKKLLRNITLLAAMCMVLAMQAQPKDKVLNRPYADLKRLHFGFSVGVAFQNLGITNNGFVTDDGEQWFAEVPNNSPGFTVGVLADLRLNNHFNLRVSPGMQFGSKVVRFRNANDPEASIERQNVKSTYVVLPVDLKYSALRYHNCRPYMVAGVMGVLDVSKQRSEQFKFVTTDAMLTIGFGCDFYLPYFKFIPELKFCFGLRNILQKNRPDLEDDLEMQKFTQSVDKIASNMVVLTFYFE